jgi:hypothetical protein
VSIVKTTVRVRTADDPTAIQARHTEHTVEPRSNRMRSMACRFEMWYVGMAKTHDARKNIKNAIGAVVVVEWQVYRSADEPRTGEEIA